MGISVLHKSDMLEYFLPYIPMSKFYCFFIIPVDDDLNRFEFSLYNDVFKQLKICPEYWFLKIFIYFLSVLPGKNSTPLVWSQSTPEDYKLIKLKSTEPQNALCVYIVNSAYSAFIQTFCFCFWLK